MIFLQRLCSSLFFADILQIHLSEIIELARHIRLCGREQVSVVIRDIDAFVTDPIRNRYSRISHVDQQGNVAVTEIVDSNTLYACGSCAATHPLPTR